ncbi:uncharacterized protein [Diabrotica undecimpunctata]|uniref:uncharacterized protein n=1 Tax=Diabrotica undecimpunctata TaxID=50387 RepID=UPI003B63ECDE
MARNRKRKTNIGTFSQEQMKAAVRLVVQENLIIRRAAELQGVAYVTLFRYVRKVKANPDSDTVFRPKYDVRLIFTHDEEKTLVDYILTSAKMCYGLTPLECRKLAFESATNKEIPNNWKKQTMAGREWYFGFRKRHPELSCRKPEACSLSRSTAFNRHNVSTFFKNLETVLKRESRFSYGSRVFNLDETGTTTVHAPPKILAKKGMKQVSQCTSGDRGVLVTTCSIIYAGGYALPPAMVFPRVHFKEMMIQDAPAGTLGLAASSGWINRELFPQVMEHFIKYSSSSCNNPSLLIMDNHESHLSMETLDLAKSNGVTILTLPPHCSNKMQSLDVAVFSSFKAHYNNAMQG